MYVNNQMLKVGKVKTPSEAWPSRSAQKIVACAGRERSVSGDNGGSESEEYLQVAPRHHTSLSDAIQAALDSYSKESGTTMLPAFLLCNVKILKNCIFQRRVKENERMHSLLLLHDIVSSKFSVFKFMY